MVSRISGAAEESDIDGGAGIESQCYLYAYGKLWQYESYLVNASHSGKHDMTLYMTLYILGLLSRGRAGLARRVAVGRHEPG